MQHIVWKVSEQGAAIYITNAGVKKSNPRNVLLAKKSFWLIALLRFSTSHLWDPVHFPSAVQIGISSIKHMI